MVSTLPTRDVLARVFRALGDPTRLALLADLAERERTVGDLVARLGVSQPLVSRHLRILREAGLVRDHRRARHVIYAIDPLAVADLADALTTFGRPGAERLRAHAAALSRPAGEGASGLPAPGGSVLFVE